MIESLQFILTKNPTHIINCATAATNTVDMFVQMISEVEPAFISDLEAFIQDSPFMIKEVKRQALVSEEIAKIHTVNTDSIAYLRSINGQDNIINLDMLVSS